MSGFIGYSRPTCWLDARPVPTTLGQRHETCYVHLGVCKSVITVCGRYSDGEGYLLSSTSVHV